MQYWSLFRSSLLLVMILTSSLAYGGTSAISPVETDRQPEIHETLVIPVFALDEAPSTSVGCIAERMKDVREYFLENSYSKTTFHSQILGWVELHDNLSTYVAVSHYENGANRTTVNTAIFGNTLEALGDSVEFGQFDTLMLVHAGPSDQATNDGKHIGSCRVSNDLTARGTTFHGAVIVSEFDPTSTICHELAHQLDAPDLYDYLGRNASIGPWCLMGRGDGDMCGYTKLTLGFVEDHEVCTLIDKTLRVTLSPISCEFSGYRLIRYELHDGRFLLAEARNAIDADGVLDSGVLLYIVNETAIEHRLGGIEVLFLEDMTAWEDAVLKLGECFALPEYNFSIRIVDIGTEGYTVDVGTSIMEEWVLCERFAVTAGSRILDTDLVWTEDYKGDIVYYASAVVRREGWTVLQLYNSTDLGREWSLMYDSGTNFNVSSSDNGLVFYDQDLWFISEFQVRGLWTVGAGYYADYSNTVHIHDLSSHLNGTLITGPLAACDSQRLYVGVVKGNSATRAVVCIQRFNGTWSSEAISIGGEVTEFCMTEAPDDCRGPWIVFYNLTGEYIVRFGDTTLFTLVNRQCSQVHAVLRGTGTDVASYVVENESVYLRVYHWAPDNVSKILLDKRVEGQKLYLVARGPMNDTWIFAKDNGTLFWYRITNESSTMDELGETLADFGEFAAPEVPCEKVDAPLILVYSQDRVSTLACVQGPPHDGVLTLWFFWDTEETVQPDALPLAVAVCIFVLAIAVLTIYVKRKHSA